MRTFTCQSCASSSDLKSSTPSDGFPGRRNPGPAPGGRRGVGKEEGNDLWGGGLFFWEGGHSDHAPSPHRGSEVPLGGGGQGAVASGGGMIDLWGGGLYRIQTGVKHRLFFIAMPRDCGG